MFISFHATVEAMGKQPSTYLSGHVREMLRDYCVAALIASVILFIVSWFVNYMVVYYVGGGLFLMSILTPFVTKWRPKERISPNGKAVFISGCDTGFGHLLAQRLDDIGFHVFAGCLFPDGDGAMELRKSTSDRLHLIGLDVTDDVSIENAASYVDENLKDNVLWAVVNNAGINEGGELHWTSLEAIRRVIEVNTIGVVRVTKAFLSKLKESKGRVLTVASVAGRYTYPGLVPYSMSKTAAIAFCDGLRLEMYKWGIPVISIEPYSYKTPITNKAVLEKRLRQTWEKASEDIKEYYDSDYIEKFIKTAVHFGTEYARSPLEVVSVIEEGITLLHPDYSYSPGGLLPRIFTWFLQSLPKPFADMVVLLLVKFYGLK